MAFDTLWIFAAAYETEEAAKADYDAVKELYKSTGLIDTYDAAVFTKGKDGKVDVVHKRSAVSRSVSRRAPWWRSSPRWRSERVWSWAVRPAPGSGRWPDTWRPASTTRTSRNSATCSTRARAA